MAFHCVQVSQHDPFLKLITSYQWMFHISVCIYTLNDYTIFHFIQIIAFYVHFM